MKGKYKLLALTLISLFASLTIVSAKEMTIKELGAEVDKVDPGVRYAFVIGTHVFSGNKELSTEDVMVGAWTVGRGEDNVTNPNVLLEKMSINVIRRSTPTSDDWYVDTPVLGEKLDATAKVDADYVNYNYNGETVNTDTVVTNAVSALNAAIAADSALKDNVTISYSNGTITVKAVSGTELTADELVKLLKTEIKSGNYSSIKLTQIVAADSSATATVEEIKDENDVANAVSEFVTDNTSFTIEFVTVDGIANQGSYSKYSVKFTTLVNTNTFFTANKVTSGNYVFDCTKVEGSKNCKLSLDLKNVFTVTTGTRENEASATPTKYSAGDASFDKLVNAIKAAADNENVKSVTVKIGGTTNVFTSNSIESEISSAISSAFATTASKSTTDLLYSDLLNQKVTITIALDETSALSQNDKTTEVYEFTITGTTNTEETISDSIDGTSGLNSKAGKTGDYDDTDSNSYLRYTVDFDEESNTITFRLNDNPTIIPFTSNSDLADVISDLYFSGLYKSVTIKGAGVSDFVISPERETALKDYIKTDNGSAGNSANITKADIFAAYLEWMVQFGGNGSIVDYKAKADKKSFDTWNVTTTNTTKYSDLATLSRDNSADSTAKRAFNLSQLIGKTIKLQLEYVNDGVINESGVNTYVIKFTSSIDTDAKVNELIDTLGVNVTIDPKNANTVVDLTSETLTGKIDSSEFVTKLRAQANEFASIIVTFNGENYTIVKNAGDEDTIASYGDLKALKEALDATDKIALKGQKITVKYGLLNNVTNLSKNGELYTFNYTLVRNTKAEVNNSIKAFNGSALVAKDLGTNEYVSENKTITFEVKLPTTTVGDLGLGLTTQLANFFANDWYKSITFIYNGTRYAVTCDKGTASVCTADKVKGVDKLIAAMGGEDIQIGEVTDSTTSFKIEFILADGVTNQEVTNGKSTTNDETTLVYDIVLSKKINAKDILEENFFTKLYSKSSAKFDPNTDNIIRILYTKSDDVDGYIWNFFARRTNFDALNTILSDTRFDSIELTIGNADSLKIVKGYSYTESDIKDIFDVVFKEIIEQTKSTDSAFDYKTANVSTVIEALGTNKITLKLNLKSGRAVFEENNDTTITYELVFTEKADITEAVESKIKTQVGSSSESSWTNNNLVVKATDDNKDEDVTVKFDGNNLEDLFVDTNKISSIEINGVMVSADEVADANANGGNDPEKLVTRLNKAIEKVLGITEDKTTVTAKELAN